MIQFSFIIPVYNRPLEIKELLESFKALTTSDAFEIVIIEDGSTLCCSDIVAGYQDALDISYYQKPNTGPGDSRNFGMGLAKGNYYIILDSDVLLSPRLFGKSEHIFKTQLCRLFWWCRRCT